MIIFRMVGTFFWVFVSLFTFVALLFVVPQAYKSDTVTVPYLDGQRVCQGGYDFRIPRCVYVLSHEWDSKKHQMRRGVLDAETNEFLHYDGWYIRRNEIKEDVIRMMSADVEQSSTGYVSHHYLHTWVGAVLEYQSWDAVNWDIVNSGIQELQEYDLAKQGNRYE